jgi:hypothetical protein
MNQDKGVAASFTGGCRCGAIRYRVSGQPVYAVSCHCRDCQYDSGGAPAHGLVFAAEAFTLEQGRLQTYEAAAASGNTAYRSFCPRCGTPVSGGSRGFDRLFVKAGSLDDPSLFTPKLAIWTDDAPAWHRLDPAVPSFPRNPPAANAAG